MPIYCLISLHLRILLNLSAFVANLLLNSHQLNLCNRPQSLSRPRLAAHLSVHAHLRALHHYPEPEGAGWAHCLICSSRCRNRPGHRHQTFYFHLNFLNSKGQRQFLVGNPLFSSIGPARIGAGCRFKLALAESDSARWPLPEWWLRSPANCSENRLHIRHSCPIRRLYTWKSCFADYEPKAKARGHCQIEAPPHGFSWTDIDWVFHGRLLQWLHRNLYSFINPSSC